MSEHLLEHSVGIVADEWNLEQEIEQSTRYDGMLTISVGTRDVLSSHLLTAQYDDTSGLIEPAVPLPAYPTREPELVAPEDTHRRYIKRQNAERHNRLAWRAGAWVVGTAMVVGAGNTAFKYDQNTVANIAWGQSAASTYPLASNNYRGPIRNVAKTSPESWRYGQLQPATVSLAVGGMGINDAGPTIARPLVPSLSKAIPNSMFYAMRYGSRVYLPDMFQAVDEMLTNSPADEVWLEGMSTGCKSVLYIGAYIHQYWPETHVKGIGCDSGPLDAYSTYELRRDPSKISMGEYSAKARLFGGPFLASGLDMLSDDTKRKYMKPNGGIDWDKFNEETSRIIRDKWTNSAATNELRVGQLALIVDNSAEENIAIIADTPAGMPPTQFVYIAPIHDTVVDGKYAANGYQDLTITYGMPYKNIPVDSEHAGDNDYADNYNVVISDVMSQIDAENQLWRDLHGDYSQTVPLRVGGL